MACFAFIITSELFANLTLNSLFRRLARKRTAAWQEIAAFAFYGGDGCFSGKDKGIGRRTGLISYARQRNAKGSGREGVWSQCLQSAIVRDTFNRRS